MLDKRFKKQTALKKIWKYFQNISKYHAQSGHHPEIFKNTDPNASKYSHEGIFQKENEKQEKTTHRTIRPKTGSF